MKCRDYETEHHHLCSLIAEHLAAELKFSYLWLQTLAACAIQFMTEVLVAM